MWLSSRVQSVCMEENADHRGRDNPAPKPLKDVPCRIRTQCHQIGGQVLDQWSRSLKCRKQVEKLGFYAFLCVITSCVWENKERGFGYLLKCMNVWSKIVKIYMVIPLLFWGGSFFQSQFFQEIYTSNEAQIMQAKNALLA